VLPYHVAAGPVVIAAFSPEIERRVLSVPRTQLTGQTITGKRDLRNRFAEVRESGYALSNEDYVDEVSAVAAPVIGPDGVAVGSLSLGGPATRFRDEALLKAMIKSVVEAAAEVTRRMGS
jgi:DNA-binding IclR family transcriptional regulator